MAERVTMWKAKSGRFFESLREAEEDDRAEEMLKAFNSMPNAVSCWSMETLASYLAGEGYRITNINPVPASD